MLNKGADASMSICPGAIPRD